MTNVVIECRASSDADKCPNIWWVIDSAGPDEVAQTGGFVCRADSRRIGITRTPGAADQGGLLEGLRGLGASDDLIENLRWILPVAGGDGELANDSDHITSITIFSGGGSLL